MHLTPGKLSIFIQRAHLFLIDFLASTSFVRALRFEFEVKLTVRDMLVKKKMY